MTIGRRGLYYVYGNKRAIGNSRNDDRNISVCVSHNFGVDAMKVGDLVKSIHDNLYHGIVMELGPKETRTDHGDGVVKVLWNDGETTCEFVRMIEVLSEGR